MHDFWLNMCPSRSATGLKWELATRAAAVICDGKGLKWLPFASRRARTPPRRARRTLMCVESTKLLRRGYPLSLSILISGGKETYKDSPSNSERAGKSPALELGGFAIRIVVWRSVLCGGLDPIPLERGAKEGESPVVPGPCCTTRRCHRVGLFGIAALSGR